MEKIKEFLRLESAGGILLIGAAFLAVVIANSPLGGLYDSFLELIIQIRVGEFGIEKPLLLWINDGLMAIFFLLIGLEVKREIVEGELSNISQASLPIFAAVGGMVVPAVIYVSINSGDTEALRGWAIPAATDIAFALGILSLLGRGIPDALKIFLSTLAIIDDLGAILIIALFYTSKLSLVSLLIGLGAIIILWIFNKRGVTHITPYLLVGIVFWVAVLKSGVHATLAGVILAFFIPLKKKDPEGVAPLTRLEHDLHSSVAFFILPLFAFANAGVNLSGITLSSFLHPVSLGIFLGLFAGKQLGVWGFSWLAVKVGWSELPARVDFKLLYGVAALAGIGFTMSLFIASLAFEQGAGSYLALDRLGILSGSLVSALLG
ncbi:MAG TPA: Na+/H+ antiporter NhaA, partial [bacterium]|nr:Na+/H+ antiporter NhaA [bacterium]